MSATGVRREHLPLAVEGIVGASPGVLGSRMHEEGQGSAGGLIPSNRVIYT